MKTFIKILADVSNIEGIVNGNEDFMDMIDVRGDAVKNCLVLGAKIKIKSN